MKRYYNNVEELAKIIGGGKLEEELELRGRIFVGTGIPGSSNTRTILTYKGLVSIVPSDVETDAYALMFSDNAKLPFRLRNSMWMDFRKDVNGTLSWSRSGLIIPARIAIPDDLPSEELICIDEISDIKY